MAIRIPRRQYKSIVGLIGKGESGQTLGDPDIQAYNHARDLISQKAQAEGRGIYSQRVADLLTGVTLASYESGVLSSRPDLTLGDALELAAPYTVDFEFERSIRPLATDLATREPTMGECMAYISFKRAVSPAVHGKALPGGPVSGAGTYGELVNVMDGKVLNSGSFLGGVLSIATDLQGQNDRWDSFRGNSLDLLSEMIDQSGIDLTQDPADVAPEVVKYLIDNPPDPADAQRLRTALGITGSGAPTGGGGIGGGDVVRLANATARTAAEATVDQKLGTLGLTDPDSVKQLISNIMGLNPSVPDYNNTPLKRLYDEIDGRMAAKGDEALEKVRKELGIGLDLNDPAQRTAYFSSFFGRWGLGLDPTNPDPGIDPTDPACQAAWQSSNLYHIIQHIDQQITSALSGAGTPGTDEDRVRELFDECLRDVDSRTNVPQPLRNALVRFTHGYLDVVSNGLDDLLGTYDPASGLYGGRQPEIDSGNIVNGRFISVEDALWGTPQRDAGGNLVYAAAHDAGGRVVSNRLMRQDNGLANRTGRAEGEIGQIRRVLAGAPDADLSGLPDNLLGVAIHDAGQASTTATAAGTSAANANRVARNAERNSNRSKWGAAAATLLGIGAISCAAYALATRGEGGVVPMPSPKAVVKSSAHRAVPDPVRKEVLTDLNSSNGMRVYGFNVHDPTQSGGRIRPGYIEYECTVDSPRFRTLTPDEIRDTVERETLRRYKVRVPVDSRSEGDEDLRKTISTGRLIRLEMSDLVDAESQEHPFWSGYPIHIHRTVETTKETTVFADRESVTHVPRTTTRSLTP